MALVWDPPELLVPQLQLASPVTFSVWQQRDHAAVLFLHASHAVICVHVVDGKAHSFLAVLLSPGDVLTIQWLNQCSSMNSSA